ncbi:hypothetical protein FQR65_LT20671 [Abscondita terminalis]|nr:hypothetical protein FQR65_LT20671 [Abscondita terminalis]
MGSAPPLPCQSLCTGAGASAKPRSGVAQSRMKLPLLANRKCAFLSASPAVNFRPAVNGMFVADQRGPWPGAVLAATTAEFRAQIAGSSATWRLAPWPAQAPRRGVALATTLSHMAVVACCRRWKRRVATAHCEHLAFQGWRPEFAKIGWSSRVPARSQHGMRWPTVDLQAAPVLCDALHCARQAAALAKAQQARHHRLAHGSAIAGAAILPSP